MLARPGHRLFDLEQPGLIGADEMRLQPLRRHQLLEKATRYLVVALPERRPGLLRLFQQPLRLLCRPDPRHFQGQEAVLLDDVVQREAIIRLGAQEVTGNHRRLRRNEAAFTGDPEHADQRCHDLRKRSEEHTSELQSRPHLVCRLLLEKKKKNRRQKGALCKRLTSSVTHNQTSHVCCSTLFWNCVSCSNVCCSMCGY